MGKKEREKGKSREFKRRERREVRRNNSSYAMIRSAEPLPCHKLWSRWYNISRATNLIGDNEYMSEISCFYQSVHLSVYLHAQADQLR